MPMQSSGSHLLPTRCTWIHLFLAHHPRIFMQHLLKGTTCVLFTLRNSCTSSYASHALYASFPSGRLRPIYFEMLYPLDPFWVRFSVISICPISKVEYLTAFKNPLPIQDLLKIYLFSPTILKEKAYYKTFFIKISP